MTHAITMTLAMYFKGTAVFSHSATRLAIFHPNAPPPYTRFLSLP